MKYTAFYFENYRGISKKLVFELKNDSRLPHCIIGNNESGKTTILKGIELVGKLCDGNTIQNGERNAIKPKGDYFSGTVTLGAILSANDNELNAALKKSLKLNNDFTINIEFNYTFKNASFVEQKTILSINDKTITTKKDDVLSLIKDKAPQIIYYDDFKFSVPSKVRFLQTGKEDSNDALLISPNNRYWKHIFDDLLKGVDQSSNGFQSDIVDWLANPNNDPNASEGRLERIGDHLASILTSWIKNSKSNIDGFRIIKKSSQNEDEKKFNDYQIKIKSGSNLYDANERSKGFQWSFCFHILTTIRKNRHSRGFIFLLDEPANNLHINPQSEMLQHLKNLCNNSNLAIYSTHSPELISDENNFENIYIAKNNAKEFEDTNINICNLKQLDDKVDIIDIEPIFVKLSYAAIKSIGGVSDNSKTLWSNIVKKIEDNKSNIDIVSKLSTISNFALNFLNKLFGL